ncbi:MAG: aldehyde dehydrogenase family protein [Gemmatimonadaceae bacterium]
MSYGPAPESDAAARNWLTRHEQRFGHFIGGRWTTAAAHAADGSHFDVYEPATGAVLAHAAQGTVADVDAAVAAARAAFPRWSALPGHARARYLYALARGVQKHARLFAVLETLDNGKSIRETRDLDIPLVARHFYHHAGWAQLLESEFPGYGPLGVVGQIIPWNFPLLMLAWKVAPALAAGNTVVLKPAEFTPLTALRFAELAEEVGLPPGVLNVVTGDGETGKALVAHAGVDKIAFTGSTEVGKQIRRATAGSGKKLSLELGGKGPFIVFDDADLDSVVEGVVDAIWFNQGQVCCAGSRLIAQEGVADQLHDKLRARMERLRVGSPLDKSVDMGAIIAPVQLDRIRALVEQGVAEGATCWQPSWACPTDGWFHPPTLFTGVAPASTIAQVEIFGPVLVSMTFRTPDEAVALANNSPYGLAASVWTENVNLALDVAPKLQCGVVWVNATNLFDAAAGFGGYRESGFGREGGREGMWEYLTRGEGVGGGGEGAGRIGTWGPPPENQSDAGSSTEHHPSSLPASAASLDDRPSAYSADGGGEDVDTDSDTDDAPSPVSALPALDRTPKLFLAGRQARPDSGYSIAVHAPDGRLIGQVGEGSRKDIRNAVEAAHAGAKAWTRATGHARAQILYYVAENLSARSDEMARRIAGMTGAGRAAAADEVEATIARLFTYGAWADKYDGAVHGVPIRGVAIAMHEPIGVLGVVAPERWPLLGFISLVAPAIAMGNTVVAVPSARHPLAATDLYQVFETSDLPAGVVNVVTGDRDTLARVLAEHDDVDGVWYVGSADGVRAVEYASAGNMKRTWCERDDARDWRDPRAGEGRAFLRHATQVKNVWVPYGE